MNDCSVVLGERKVLDRFALDIRDFEHTAIIGPNGSGKSTFIRLLMRDVFPSLLDGEKPHIEILERDDWNLFELRRAVAVVSLKLMGDLLDSLPLTVFDAVASSFFGTYGFFADDKIPSAQKEATEKTLALLHLDIMQKRGIETLSTGELRKVMIARAIVTGPRLLLLDEPTLGLDVAAQADFMNYLSRVARQTTILMVTHHLEDILPQTKKVLLVKQGKIFCFGPTEDILTSANMTDLFDVPVMVQRAINGGFSMQKT